MFTGLVQEIGTVIDISHSKESSRVSINTSLARSLQVGDSISINGACLTAVSVDQDVFAADVMIQTLKLTSLGELVVGSKVNAELAAELNSRLGGHLVQGHVDGVAEVIENSPGEKWQKFSIQIPSHLLKYIVNQGSITVDGVSLTVGEVIDSKHEVVMWLIPETLSKTTLGSKAAGHRVNIEVDVLAKYVERMMQFR